MTAPATTATHLEILVLASDTDDRHTLTAQALSVLMDFDPAAVAIDSPARLRIRQTGREIFDHSGPLSSVFYRLTEWGYGVAETEWGRTPEPSQP